jgi:hypothetical protein
VNAKINSAKARARADELEARLQKRLEELEQERRLSPERQLGYEPRDVSQEKCGYDIESCIPGMGRLRFIEVKGRISAAKTVTVTKNEIITA